MRSRAGEGTRRVSESPPGTVLIARGLSRLRPPEDALDSAVRLYRSPGIARNIRRLALPTDVLTVIRVAAGCAPTLITAAARTGLDHAALQQIASLYLLVALFGDEGDARRTLGLGSDADPSRIQDHRNWLLKWLHPDRNRSQSLSGLSVRVIDASARLTEALAIPEPSPADLQQSSAARRRRDYRHVWLRRKVEE